MQDENAGPLVEKYSEFQGADHRALNHVGDPSMSGVLCNYTGWSSMKLALTTEIDDGPQQLIQNRNLHRGTERFDLVH